MKPINKTPHDAGSHGQQMTPAVQRAVDAADKRGQETCVPSPAQRPCRSPYCECEPGKCTHPSCYDARAEPLPKDEL